MRSETAIWIAIAVCVLTLIGAVIALVKGATVIGVGVIDGDAKALRRQSLDLRYRLPLRLPQIMSELHVQPRFR